MTPSVLRYLLATGEKLARREGGECGSHYLLVGSEHPCYEVAARCLPRASRPYAHYIRVADLPAFLGLLRPVCERRLAASPLAGQTGECRISFYRDGLRLVLARGGGNGGD